MLNNFINDTCVRKLTEAGIMLQSVNPKMSMDCLKMALDLEQRSISQHPQTIKEKQDASNDLKTLISTKLSDESADSTDGDKINE